MKAIIWKELRENARWAMVIVWVLGMGMAWAVSWDAGSGVVLVGERMRTVTGFGFAGAGFALGVLQVVQDRRRGRWAFLVHRPISKTAIFWGKLMSGCLLYFMATGLPLALTVGWVATPGHVAGPFDWHGILPRMTDMAMGIVGYLLGWQVAVRKARWLGSRAMPSVCGLFLLMGMAVSPTVWYFALFWVVGVFAYLVTAWGYFVNNGRDEELKWPARILGGLSVGMGICITILAGVGISVDTMRSAGLSLGQRTVTAQLPTDQQYEINQDGMVTYYASGDQGGRVDAMGNSVPVSKELSVAWLHLDETHGVGNAVEHGDTAIGFQDARAYINGLPLPNRGAYAGSGIEWFYVCKRRTIEGYDYKTRLLVASIGPDGFRGPNDTTVPFAETLRTVANEFGPEGRAVLDLTVVATANEAYVVDATDRTVRRIFIADGGERILDASFAFEDSLVLIATDSRLHVIRGDRELFHAPLDHGFPPHRLLAVGRPWAGRYILQYTDADEGIGGAAPHPSDWVEEANDKGEIVRQKEVNPKPTRFSSWDSNPDNFLMLLTPPATAPLLLYSESGPDELRPTLGFVLGGLGSVALVSSIAAWFLGKVYLRRRAWRRFWIVVAFLCGIPGVLMMISVNDRKAVVKCSKCGKWRSVGNEQCEHCGAEMAAPKMEGIEVFETAGVA